MSKDCKNCIHYFNIGSKASPCYICKHPYHCGDIITRSYATCDKYEEEAPLIGPFKDIKFFLKCSSSGKKLMDIEPLELEMNYKCCKCGKLMKDPYHWQLRLPLFGNKSAEFVFWCKDCWEKENDGKKDSN